MALITKHERYKSMIKEVSKRTNGEFQVRSSYEAPDTPLLFFHNTLDCGQESWRTPVEFFHNKYPCPHCRNKKIANRNTKTHQTFIKEVAELYGDEYTVLSKYTKSKAPILIRHNSAACNYHEYFPTPNNFLRRAGCPACNGSPSFPEMCLLLEIRRFFPEAKKQRIQNRECDIVFSVHEKQIGLQYDGAFYHKDPQRDNLFNKIFLKNKNRFLIRIREIDCPKLESHDRLYEVCSASNYTLKNLQETLKNVFYIINTLLGTNYESQLKKESMHMARKYSKKAYQYELLLEEYLNYLHNNHAMPHGKSENKLQSRIATAIREQRFSEVQLSEIISVQKQYALYIEERDPALIYHDMIHFYKQNEMLPRQQAGGKVEALLHQEIKKCANKGKFKEKQMKEYIRLCKIVSNYPTSADQLYSDFIQFIQDNQRLPSFNSSDKDEKMLVSKVSHRLRRKTFSPEQQHQIEQIRIHYSRKRIRERIIEEYQLFLAQNDRLPFYKADGAEGKLEENMLRYLRKHCFTTEECEKILAMRSKYQLLTRRLKEYVDYQKGRAENFVRTHYEMFCSENGRLPVKRLRNRDEYDLCRLVLKYLDPTTYPLGSPYNKKPKQQKNKTNKTPTETFEEALAFYKENGRFPLHVHRRNTTRPYEGKLAARVTALYVLNRFTTEQVKQIDRLRIKQKDRVDLLYEHFFDYIKEHGSEILRHRPGTDERRLLNSIKNHMRQGRYTKKQLDELLKYIPGRRRTYPSK